MAENTKTPPNQDQQRQRTPQGDANKQQKPGGPAPTGANQDRDRGRQGVNNPGKPGGDIDPNRIQPGRNKPGDLDDDEAVTPPIDRE
jgi:hypothetical protein